MAAAGARLEGRGCGRLGMACRLQEQPLHRYCLCADPAGQGDGSCRVGATPGDFAYAVHTSLGHRCRGARVDGTMVPLHQPLKNGQRVEIIAAKQGGPSRDWLNADLDYVHSHRARTKVRQWFKAQQHEETVAQGRALVERELARAGATAVSLDAVAVKAGFARADELYVAGRTRRASTCGRSSDGDPRGARIPMPLPAHEEAPEIVARQSKAAGSGQRHPRRRRRSADDESRALLQARTARRHRRFRHARQGGDDPSPARAATSLRHAPASQSGLIGPRREPWGAARDEVSFWSTSCSRRWTGREGSCATSPRSFAGADQRHCGEHADAEQRDSHGIRCAGGEEPRGAHPGACAGAGTWKGVLVGRGDGSPAFHPESAATYRLEPVEAVCDHLWCPDANSSRISCGTVGLPQRSRAAVLQRGDFQGSALRRRDLGLESLESRAHGMNLDFCPETSTAFRTV